MMLRTQTPAISAGELCRALIKAEPAFEKSDQYESIVCRFSGRPQARGLSLLGGRSLDPGRPGSELEPIAERNPDPCDPWDGLTFAGLLARGMRNSIKV